MTSLVRSWTANSVTVGHAFESNGKVITSWIDTNGLLGISRFDGNVWRHAPVDATLTFDIHNHGTVITDSAGKVMVAYCDHEVSGIWLRKSATAYGVDLAARVEIVSSSPAACAYPNFVKTDNGRIWLFYNRSTSLNRPVYYVTSDDDGATWSAETQIWSATSNLGRAYYGVAAVGNEVLFVCNLGNATGDGLAYNVVHAYFMRHDGTGWKKTGGTAVTLPGTPSNTDQCYNAATNSENFGFGPRLFKDSSGRYGLYVGGYAANATESHYLCRFESGAWTQNRFLASVSTTGGGAVPTIADPYTVYLIKPDGSAVNQIFRGDSTDGGATWTYTQITTDAWAWPIDVITKVAGGTTCPYMYCPQTRTSNTVWSSHLVAAIDVNHWMDDFADTVAAATPLQWSKEIGSSGLTFVGVAHPDDATKTAARITQSSQQNKFLSFIPAKNLADGEILARIRPEVTSTNRVQVMGRVEGHTQTTMPRYWVGGAATMAALRVSANTVQQGSDIAYTTGLNTWHYMRFKLVGNTQKLRVWAAGSTEPTTWQYEFTSTTQNVAGLWGIFTFLSTTNIVVDWLSFAKGSNSALRPDQVDSLSGAAALAGAAVSVSTATGSISTSITLAGSSASVSVADGTLTTQITLSGAALAQATATAALASGAAEFAGSAASLAAAVGVLTTEIRLSGAAIAQVIANAALTAGGDLAGAALSSSSASGVITTEIPLVGDATATASATGSIGSPVLLDGAAASVSNATGDLTVSIALSGSSLAAAIASGVLTTQISLSAAALSQALASATFNVPAVLAAARRRIANRQSIGRPRNLN